jgi:hypothetical protein
MKHWLNKDDSTIRLSGGEKRILSVERKEGVFRLREECDSYFVQDYTKEEVLELIEELRLWVIK